MYDVSSFSQRQSISLRLHANRKISAGTIPDVLISLEVVASTILYKKVAGATCWMATSIDQCPGHSDGS